MAALAGDALAQFCKDTDGVTLADVRNLWHNSNGNQFPGATSPVGLGIATSIFLDDFEPKLNGFPDMGQRLSVRRPLAVAAWQGGTGNRKPFLGFHHDHLILHGLKILWLNVKIKFADCRYRCQDVLVVENMK